MKKTHQRNKRPLAHRGFILDASSGIVGCTRAICAGNGGHDAVPGVFVGGFVGGNIGGFVELGVQGGWGQLRNRASNGRNPAAYWGMSPSQIQDSQALPTGLVDISMVDAFAHARTHAVELSTFNAAPLLRLHFVPRGRAIAFVGAGAGYGGIRGDHETDRGPLQLTAHGLAVPAQAGLGVHITKNVAAIARFDYIWTHYLLLELHHAEDVAVLPTSIADKLSSQGGLGEELPHFWTVTLGLRARLF